MNDTAFSAALDALPAPLRGRVQGLWQDFRVRAGAVDFSAEFLRELVRVWACSEFAADICLRYPQTLFTLHASGDLRRPLRAENYPRLLDECLAELDDQAAADQARLDRALRRFRRLHMLRIAWRDLTGHGALDEIMGELSALADACIDGALARLYRWHCAQWGTPRGEDGGALRLVVLGMGKLGAQELNFSSDVDLIYAYAEEGQTRGGPRSVSHQEFFVRLAQRLGQALSAPTAEGFVFRVDTRLRPFGESSALALSFEAMENYYPIHGREWERYALIKARAVAGDRQAGAELLDLLKPFVYRRYIDYGVFSSLREMKAMIAREVQRKGMEDNVKLGAGGIREIEFIGQVFQLVRGGREPGLRVRPIQAALAYLQQAGLLPEFVVGELQAAYVFLRTVEHRLQEYQDRQTHALPEDAPGRLRLAWSLGFADWPAFERVLRAHMRRVHQHFEQVFAAPQTEHAASDRLDLSGVWLENLDDAQAQQALGEAGYGDPQAVYAALQQLRRGREFLRLSAQGRTRFNQLMPLLLGAVGQGEQPDATLQRLLALLETVARRSAYLALLVENPMALSQLVRLCAASPWVASQLAHYPLLLDELLDPRSLYAPPRRAELEVELRRLLAQIDAGDQEAQLDALRHFKQTNTLRVAAADLMDAVPLMVVSDHLTELAEVLLQEAFRQSWQHLAVRRHGLPPCLTPADCRSGFAIIAYGKLGGIELGYGSDLDIVFLHADEAPSTLDIDSGVLYMRLAQRIIHTLATTTAAGRLYEVDTRLRPSGSSGPLVSSLTAFALYQHDAAWTWEHQALARARGVAGDPALIARFEQIRREALSAPREPQSLRGEVREMRQRMRRELSRGSEDKFDLKQDPGGIADIEFMVQYAVLAWAHAHPFLLDFTDTIRLLERLAEASLMPAQDARLLADAYRAFRAQVHRLALQEKPALVDNAMFAELRAQVVRIWRAWMN